jgi:hypothetical protein
MDITTRRGGVVDEAGSPADGSQGNRARLPSPDWSLCVDRRRSARCGQRHRNRGRVRIPASAVAHGGPTETSPRAVSASPPWVRPRRHGRRAAVLVHTFGLAAPILPVPSSASSGACARHKPTAARSGMSRPPGSSGSTHVSESTDQSSGPDLHGSPVLSRCWWLPGRSTRATVKPLGLVARCNRRARRRPCRDSTCAIGPNYPIMRPSKLVTSQITIGNANAVRVARIVSSLQGHVGSRRTNARPAMAPSRPLRASVRPWSSTRTTLAP